MSCRFYNKIKRGKTSISKYQNAVNTWNTRKWWSKDFFFRSTQQLIANFKRKKIEKLYENCPLIRTQGFRWKIWEEKEQFEHIRD